MSSEEDLNQLLVAELQKERTEVGVSSESDKPELISHLTEYQSGEVTSVSEDAVHENTWFNTAQGVESDTVVKEDQEMEEYGAEKEEEDAEKGDDAEADREEEEPEREGEEAEKEDSDEKKVRPVLSRGKFVFMYGAMNSLRTVIIKPFKPEFLCSDLKEWVAQAMEYEIKSDRQGVSAAALYFDKMDVGDEAYRSLKARFEASDVEVYHPPLTSKTACLKYEWFSQLFTFKLEDDYTHRMVTLENLPDSVTETVIKEKFPEAFNIIFYGQEPQSQGIATMELLSEEKVQALLDESPEIEIDGQQVQLQKLNTRINKWAKELKLGIIKTVKTAAAERERSARQTKDLTDEERQDMCNRYHETMRLKDTVKDRTDLCSDEKIKAHEEYSQEMKFLSLSMMNDTDRRYKETGTFPEPEDIMLPYTKQVLSGKLTREDKEQRRQENKKFYAKDESRKSEDRKGWSHGKGQKRSKDSKGGPPHKRANTSQGGGHNQKGGRKGGYNKGKGGRGGWDYDDRSGRGYGRDRHGGHSFPNVQSKMENAILSLAEKMSHLEKLQMRSSGMGDYGQGGYMGGMQDSGYGNEGFGGGYNMGGGRRRGGSNYNRKQGYYGGNRY